MGDAFDSGGGNINLAKDNGTAIQIQCNNLSLQQDVKPAFGTAPSIPSLIVGRENDMALLRQRLGAASPSNKVLLLGMPGIGKSTLAAALAHDVEVGKLFPDGVLWTALGTSPNVLAGLGEWLRALENDPNPLQGIAERKGRLAGLLRDRRMLLIVDDAWQANDAQQFLVGGRRCGMLITTRAPEAVRQLGWPEEDVVRLRVLSEQHSIELIRQLSPKLVEQELEGVRQLVVKLDGLPLALKVAGSLLAAEANMGWGVGDLLKELSTGVRMLLEHAPVDLADASEQVAPTVSVLFRRSTDRLDALARKQFAVLAAFAPAPATFDCAAMAAAWDVENPRTAARELVERGLLEPSGDGRFHVHALLSAHAASMRGAQDQIDAAVSAAGFAEAVQRVAQHYAAFCCEKSKMGMEGFCLLDSERMQIVRLLEACVALAMWPEAKQMADAVDLYLDRQGYWKDRKHVLSMALAAAKGQSDRRNEGESLNRLGKICHLLGDNASALEYFKQSLEISYEFDNCITTEATLNNIGAIYLSRGDYVAALKYFEQALEISIQRGHLAGEGAIRNNIGTIHFAQGRYDSALVYLKRSLAIKLKIGDQSGETLNNIGSTCCTQGDYDSARVYLDWALSTSREIGDRAGEALALNNMGEICQAQVDHLAALEYFKQSLAVRLKIGDRAGEARSLSNIGESCQALGDRLLALGYFKQSLAVRLKIGDRAGEARCLNNIGSICHAQGDYDSAIVYADWALSTSREIGKGAGEAQALNNMGDSCKALGDRLAALGYFKQSLAVRLKIGDRAGEARCLNKIGSLCHAQGDYDSAIVYADWALSTSREINNGAGEAQALSNMGESCQALGDRLAALGYFKQSLAVRLKIGDRTGEARCLNKIGSLCHAQGDYDSARVYLDWALSTSREIGDRAGEACALSNMGESCKAQGDRLAALGYHLYHLAALGYFKQSLEIRRKIGDQAGEEATLNKIYCCYHAAALECCKQILENSRKTGEAAACRTLGGLLTKAEQHLSHAVQIEEKIGHPDLEQDRKVLEQLRAMLRSEPASISGGD